MPIRVKSSIFYGKIKFFRGDLILKLVIILSLNKNGLFDLCCFRFKIKDRPSQLKLITRLAGEVSINDSQPTVSTNQSPVFSNSGNHVLEVREFGYPAPIVLTPSEASESGLGSQNGEFQFPSPPKPNPRSRDASRDRNSTNQNQPDLESLLSSPARSSSRNDFIKLQLVVFKFSTVRRWRRFRLAYFMHLRIDST